MIYAVQNIGLQPLNVSVDSSQLPAAYSVTWAQTPLDPGDERLLTLTLDSTTPGTFAGTLLLDTNDRDENPFEIRVTGLVRAAVPMADANAIVVDDEPDPTGRTSFEMDGNFRYQRRQHCVSAG